MRMPLRIERPETPGGPTGDMISGGWGKGYRIVQKSGMKPTCSHSAPIVALVAMQLAGLPVILFINPGKFGTEWAGAVVAGLFLGFSFSYVASAATWAGLGPLRLYVRIPGSLILIGMAATALIVSIIRSEPRASDHFEIIAQVCGAFAAMWLLVQLPLWIARWIYGFHLVRPAESSTDGSANELQFGIRQLLIVTAAVAGTLAMGRALLSAPGSDRERFIDPQIHTFLFLAMMVICNSLVAFTVITGALLRRFAMFGVSLGFCAGAAVTLVEVSALQRIGNSPSALEMLAYLGTMNGVQFVILLTSLLALRAAGYRLAAAILPKAPVA
jgi:hypothetical protein